MTDQINKAAAIEALETLKDMHFNPGACGSGEDDLDDVAQDAYQLVLQAVKSEHHAIDVADAVSECDLGNCEACGKPILPGQPVQSWEDAGAVHFDCDAVWALPVLAKTPARENGGPVYINLGSPMRYYPLPPVRFTREDVEKVLVLYDPIYPHFGLVDGPTPHDQHPNQQNGLDLYVRVINFDTGETCFKKLYENKRGLHFKHTGYSPMYLDDFTERATVIPFQVHLGAALRAIGEVEHG